LLSFLSFGSFVVIEHLNNGGAFSIFGKWLNNEQQRVIAILNSNQSISFHGNYYMYAN
jgi:hypothetical protein